MDNIYVVCDEHTLGYKVGGMIGILRASILKGAPFELYPAPKFPEQFKKIRSATNHDFAEFRVLPPKGLFKPQNTENKGAL